MKRYSSSNNILSSNTKLSSPSHYLKLPFQSFSKESNPSPLQQSSPSSNTHKPVQSPPVPKSTHNHQQYNVLKEKINNLGERIENIQKNYHILQKNRNKRKIKEKKGEESENDRTLHEKSQNQSPKHSFKNSRAIATKNKNFNTDGKSKRYSVKENHHKVDYVHKYDARKSLSPFSNSSSNLLKSLDMNKDKLKHQYYVANIVEAFNAYQPNDFQHLCRNHLISSIQLINYIEKSKKKLIAPVPISLKLPPPHPNRQTIIFDLDETLIHCNQTVNTPHDVTLPVRFPQNKTPTILGINVRPYAIECLKELKKYFQLIVFTASHSCYAHVVINYLDPKNELFSYRFCREHCYHSEEGFYIKDLRIIDRDLSKVLLVDNAAYSYCFQPENGVPIIPFYDNKGDEELKQLTTYLKSMYGFNDMRKRNQEQMKLGKYRNYQTATQLITSLYQ